jgi:benzylsuccinate CoA-transferase BbsF subunit
MGTMLALYYRELTGEGQHVDVSIQESIYPNLLHAPLMWEYFKVNLHRQGAFRPVVRGTNRQRLLHRCKDGYVDFMTFGGKTGAPINRALVSLMDKEGMAPDFLKNFDWENFDVVAMGQEELDKMIEPMDKFFSQHSKAELYTMAIESKVMALYPVATMEDIINDSQLKARDFWKEVKHSRLGNIPTYPGAFVKFSETPCRIRYPAPLIGEHTGEINRELNLSEGRTHQDYFKGGKAKKRALEGIKVADFSWVVMGPLISKLLADHGAEVIRVETRTQPCHLRLAGPFKGEQSLNSSGFFAVFNNDKQSISINLKNPQGREIAREIVKWADVVIENFTPGTMKKWDLDYPNLRKIKPEIIMLSLSIQGQDGPHASLPGFGWSTSSLGGFTHLTGWPDREPSIVFGAYLDIPSAYLGGAAILAALMYRARTGRGQHLDLTQYEVAMNLLATDILDFVLNGRTTSRMGNRCTYASPHGAYPCKGEDRWCAISVFSNEEWKNFCQVIGSPLWAQDPKFSTLASRKQYEDELDDLVGNWTRNFTSHEVMEKMQAVGVAAGAVQTCEDLFGDPQLAHRRHFWELEHSEIGSHKCLSPGFRLSKSPHELRKAAPCLGEHTEYVCNKILGISDEEFVELLASGVFD